jgi:hypothetical protein
MLSLFLFLLLVAGALGIIGAVATGLTFLLVLGVIVFVADLVLAGARLTRGRRLTR